MGKKKSTKHGSGLNIIKYSAEVFKIITKNALKLLETRYLLRNEKGKVIETPSRMFSRVAAAIAKIDSKYRENPENSKKEFYEVMSKLEFLPNSPTLMNAGTKLGQLSACFVIPVEDSITGIFDALKEMALIHQSGGGVGFSFSNLRPRGDIVASSKGVASGPVSFMSIFDKATEVIKQGGKRRGANIGILRVDHPDIMEFIACKSKGGFSNFNISVGITDEFMHAVENNKPFALISPRDKKIVRKIGARAIFNAIVENAWSHGDPGVIFLDEINRKSPIKGAKIESTNPCGEVPLLPYESCNLGSINLANMVKGDSIDWQRLGKTVHIAVHFLDNVLDANKFPMKIIEENTMKARKIGVGVMGFAEMLIQLGVPYDSDDALHVADKVMGFIREQAHNASIELGRKRGSFPDFKRSKFFGKVRYMRNSTVTTIAPTGSISMIADTSSGIEPIFALRYYKRVLGGRHFIEVNKYYERMKNRLSKSELKKVFKTAMEIKPEQHVKMQAVFQIYTDNAVSKTVNLPKDATKQEVGSIFMLAHKLGCKGITIYRYASKEEQVLNVCEVCR